MSKFDNWTKFLDSLNTSKVPFDQDLHSYLISLQNIAELDNLKENNGSETKTGILVNLKKISEFCEKYCTTYYEISLIKGFENIPESFDDFSQKDFYYYIADKKMKAAVYCARYINFIEETLDSTKNNQKIKLRNYLNCIKGSSPKNTSKSDCTLSGQDILNESEKSVLNEFLINQNKLVLNEELEDFIHLLEYRIYDPKQMDENYTKIKYMLFNNMMREIRYIGAGYQYLWHWKEKKATLYRAYSGEKKQDNNSNPKSRKEYLQRMFDNCISHMNEANEHTLSYSKNGLLDIYKYLIFPKPDDLKEKLLDEAGLIKLKIPNASEKKVIFEIIKNAYVNYIFSDINSPESFQEFAMGSNEEGQPYNYPYTVEIYPPLSGEKNETGTTKNMRDKFLPNYLSSWIDSNEKFNLSKTKVADDKEVITTGQIYKTVCTKIPSDNKENFFENKEDGTCFRIELNKDDFIYLLLKIAEHKQTKTKDAINAILNKLKYKKVTLKPNTNYSEDSVFEAFYKKRSSEYRDFICQFNIIDDLKFTFYISISGKIFENEPYKISNKNSYINFSMAKSDLSNDVASKILNYLHKHYTKILNTENNKVDFILSTLSEQDYCFNLIKHYKEYRIDSEDSEISMLKHIIFKEDL